MWPLLRRVCSAVVEEWWVIIKRVLVGICEMSFSFEVWGWRGVGSGANEDDEALATGG